jgi:hypothetical protein
MNPIVNTIPVYSHLTHDSIISTDLMFLDLGVHQHFTYKTLIPINVFDLVLALKGIFLHVPNHVATLV